MWKTIFLVIFLNTFYLFSHAQFSLEKSGFINAPPDVVFTYLMDLKYFPDWIGGFVSYRYKDGIPGMPGSRAYQVIQQQGIRIEFIQTIEKIKKNEYLLITLESEQINVTLEYSFIPENGGTKVNINHEVELKSFLFRTMQYMVRRNYSSNADTNFDKFKAIVENRGRVKSRQ